VDVVVTADSCIRAGSLLFVDVFELFVEPLLIICGFQQGRAVVILREPVLCADREITLVAPPTDRVLLTTDITLSHRWRVFAVRIAGLKILALNKFDLWPSKSEFLQSKTFIMSS
jgi:hypothetical protein